MPIPTLIRANGKMFTRNSCAVRMNGIFRLTDVDSLEWSDERASELVNGMNDGGAPLGKAQGPYTCSASLSVYADAASKFEAMVRASPLAITNTDPFDLSSFTFQVGIILSEDVRTRAIAWINCNVVGRPSRTVGNDGSAIVKQYQLQPLQIREDGLALVRTIPAI